MKKETILNLSRKENKNTYDEFELAVIDFSYRISRLVGGVLCAILSCLGIFLFETKVLSMGACAIYFSMVASGEIIKFIKIRKKQFLIWSIIDSLVTIASLIILFVWLV